MNYAQLNGRSIREGFNSFHAENPHVYQAFERECLKELQDGAKVISPKRIMNNLRWSDIKTNGKDFKLNDGFISYYSRLFVEKHPEYERNVPRRKLRNEEKGQYMRVEANGQLAFL